MNTIYSELSAGRPILYTGVDPGAGGHAFVFDGIDADGKIHVNWGWDGTGNGFYDIADLNPTDERGKPGNDHFNKQQSMLYGLRMSSPSMERFCASSLMQCIISTFYISMAPLVFFLKIRTGIVRRTPSCC